jgi:hypothetical protein
MKIEAPPRARVDEQTPVRSSRQTLWLFASMLTLAANIPLHKPISDVCDALFARIGRAPYERITMLAIVALSCAGVVLLLRSSSFQLVGGAASRRVMVVVPALLVLALVAQQWLLVSNVELIHFPQFGLLAAMLLFAGLSPQVAWLAASTGGVFDEVYQRLVIYAQVPNVYLDWNDMVLNAIGAALAVVIATAVRIPPPGRVPRLLPALAVAGFVVALWLAPPNLAAAPSFPYWQLRLHHALTTRDYHVMSASEGLGALLLIWGLVVFGTSVDPRTTRRTPAAALVALALIVVAGCARRPPTPATDGIGAAAAPAGRPIARGEPIAPAPFIITFWCGPPLTELTDARAAEIAAAGFTIIGAPCEGPRNGALNRRALDIAARHGLKMWIADPRVDQYHDLHPEWAARLDDAVAEYGPHPALDGYFLVDEPSADKFSDLALVVGRLRSTDPERVPYINLLPDFVSPAALGTRSYRDHVERYMDLVRPPLLSFDYYPFKTDADRASYFENLALIREVALRRGIPFLVIVQAMPHGPYRDPTEAELAWQVFHALAFGARGVSYFAYWTPVHVDGAERWQFRHGLIEDGRPTEHYHQAARLNHVAAAFAGALETYGSLAVVDSDGSFGNALPIGPLAGVDGGPVTIGVFTDGAGRFAALLVNRGYRAPVAVQLHLQAGWPLPQRLDPESRRWSPLESTALSLPAGEAALLRWSDA